MTAFRILQVTTCLDICYDVCETVQQNVCKAPSSYRILCVSALLSFILRSIGLIRGAGAARVAIDPLLCLGLVALRKRTSN